MSDPLRVVVLGAGRMGRAILTATLGKVSIQPQAVIVRRAPEAPLPGDTPWFTDLEEGLRAAPGAVVLDFALAEGAADRVRRIGRAGNPLVLGTTGLDDAAEAAAAEAGKQVAVVVAPNTSPGIVLVRRALRAAIPPPDLGWDLAIVERHHRGKRDAPSGTARLLEQDLRAGGASAVEVRSLRQGGVIGEHAVHLAGGDEEIVLLHRAFSRGVFAQGALLAAEFAGRAKPGRYAMEDVLGGS